MRILFLDCAPFMGGAQESLWTLLSELHALGRVVAEEHTETGTDVTVIASREDVERMVRRHGGEILKRFANGAEG